MINDGYFTHDLMVLIHPAQGGAAVRGFKLEVADPYHDPCEVLNHLSDQLSLFLRQHEPTERLLFQWSAMPSRLELLEQYDRDTERSPSPWVRQVRKERYQRLLAQRERGQLIDHQLVLFRLRRLSEPVSWFGSEREYASRLDGLSLEFGQYQAALSARLSPFGIGVVPLTDRDHFLHLSRLFGPSKVSFPEELLRLNPNQTILENTWDAQGVGEKEGRFFMDDHYHQILGLSRWPDVVTPITSAAITRLKLLNYRITFVVQPLDLKSEIRELEQSIRRIEQDAMKNMRLAAALTMKRARLKALVDGTLRPFGCRLTFHLWNKDAKQLSADADTVKQAIRSMAGAQYYQPALPTSVRDQFLQTSPLCWQDENVPYRLHADDSYAGLMIPLFSSFGGFPGHPHALLLSENDGLVVVSTAAGRADAPAPAHAVCVGGTGSGKGLLGNELWVQTAPFYQAEVVIDFGSSFELTCRLRGAQTIRFEPGSNLVINYLDTHGLPLGPEVLSFQVNLLSLMAKTAHDAELHARTAPLFNRFLQALYTDVFEEWQRKVPGRLMDLARRLYVIRQMMTAEIGLQEAFVDFREIETNSSENAAARLAAVPEEELTRILGEPKERLALRNLALALFKREEYPTHSMLCDLMRLKARKDERLKSLVESLDAWRTNGPNGQLLDGCSNVVLEAPLLYFELGRLQHAHRELATVAQYLAAYQGFARTLAMPRSIPKRLLFDETAAFLRIPGAAEFLASVYEQARKYNIWVCTIWQNLTALRKSSAWDAVLSNTRIFFLLQQENTHEVERLREDLGLSDRAATAIASYPSPTTREAGIHFTYFHRNRPNVICGATKNVLSPEMYWASASEGGIYEERRGILAGLEGPALIAGLQTYINSKS
jgi:hypothetical protein